MKHFTLLLLGAMVSFQLAAQHSTEFITNPKGSKTLYITNSWCVNVGQSGPKLYILEDASTEIVWGENSKVYIGNPVGPYHAWLEGTVNEDKTQITVTLPQTVNAINAEDEMGMRTKYPVVVTLGQKAEGEIAYSAVQGEQKLIYTIDQSGNISQSSPYMEEFEFDSETNQHLFPERFITTFIYAPAKYFDSTYPNPDEMVYSWMGYGVINNDLTAIDMTDIVVNQIPADVEFDEEWMVSHSKGGSTCYVYVDEAKLYIKGLFKEMPDGIVVGDIEGSKVTFADNQYLGIYDFYDVFACFRTLAETRTWDDYWEEWNTKYTLPGEPFVMEYNPQTHTLTTPASGEEGVNHGFAMNTLQDPTWHLSRLVNPMISAQNPELLNAAPANPIIRSYGYDEQAETDQLWAYLPLQNVKGAVIDARNVTFSIYVNGEKYTFTPDLYDVNHAMTELPHGIFTDDYNITMLDNNLWVNFFEEDITSVGVQTFYCGSDGVTYSSEVVTIPVTSAIGSVTGDSAPAAEMYYDLNGRPVAHPAAGQLVIKHTINADGTRTATKHLMR